MTGSIDRGSVVFAKPVPVSELRRGDVITYEGPRGQAPAGKITHRIHAIDRRASGETVLRTKGDANDSPDPWTFTLDRPTQPRAELHVPWVGLPLIALQDRTARMLGLGLPALLVAISVLAGLWREAGKEARREETGHRGGGMRQKLALGLLLVACFAGGAALSSANLMSSSTNPMNTFTTKPDWVPPGLGRLLARQPGLDQHRRSPTPPATRARASRRSSCG